VTAVLALLSSLFWGGSDFGGGVLTRRLPALLVVAASQGCALVVLLGWMVATTAWDVPAGYVPWAIAGGLTGAIALSAFYTALATGTMGVVAPIASCGVLVPVLVGLLDGERPSAAQLSGIVVAVLGVVLAAGPELRRDPSGARPAGARSVALAGIAALGFGLVFVFLARGAEQSVGMTLVLQRCVSVGFLTAVLVVLALRGRSTGVGDLRRRDVPLVLAVGAGDVAANATYAVASTSGLLAVVAVLSSLYPVVTILLARWLLAERLQRTQQAGVAIALAGVVMIAAGGGTG
jgi:drug/metabolite transporter (DMT)-like permease